MDNLPGGILSGLQSQTLRSFCTSKSYTEADLDDHSRLLRGPPESVRFDFEKKVEANGIDKTRQSFADIHYGPTKVPHQGARLQLLPATQSPQSTS